jgi:hypothetical protein
MGQSAMTELRYPDFLCIGAQKSGTSWLDANLRRHPRIWMPWIKELQYFNHIHLPEHRAWTDGHRRSHAERAARGLVRRSEQGPLDLRILHRIAAIAAEPLSDAWYGRIFAHARADQLCGEVTPEYSLLPAEGIAHVRRLNPRMKIIFLMRDPVERCWSHLRMLARGQPGFDHLAACDLPDVLDRADYPRIVAAWRGAFGHDRVFVRWIADVSDNTERFWRELSDFLEWPWHPRIDEKSAEPVFVGPDIAMPAAVEQKLRSRLAPVYDALGSLAQ